MSLSTNGVFDPTRVAGPLHPVGDRELLVQLVTAGLKSRVEDFVQHCQQRMWKENEAYLKDLECRRQALLGRAEVDVRCFIDKVLGTTPESQGGGDTTSPSAPTLRPSQRGYEFL
jgi:hypothetical protein